MRINKERGSPNRPSSREHSLPSLEEDFSEWDSLKWNEPFRKSWIWLLYVLLFSFSVPWYLPGTSLTPIWLGLPAWVVLSLAFTLAIALFTVFVIRKYWQQGQDSSMRKKGSIR